MINKPFPSNKPGTQGSFSPPNFLCGWKRKWDVIVRWFHTTEQQRNVGCCCAMLIVQLAGLTSPLWDVGNLQICLPRGPWK